LQFEYRHVRAELMRPEQLRRCREQADIAFLPLGSIEWHGLQNPIGVDALASYHVCCLAADKLGGGAVFPPVIWSLPRDSFYVDSRDGVYEEAAEALGTDSQRVKGITTHGGMDMQEQWLNYQRVVRMSLEQIAGYGFKSIFLVSGHAPIIHFIRPVAVAFARATQMAGYPVTTDFGGEWDPAGLHADHGGPIETSAMMSIDDTLVDMETLKRQPEYIGVGAGPDAVNASKEKGDQWLEACAVGLAREAQWLVENYPELPERHHHLR